MANKYNWAEIQKKYDEENLSYSQLKKIFGVSERNIIKAAITGEFHPKPKLKIVERIENCLECGTYIELKNSDDKRKKFCNHTCAAKHNNKKRDEAYYSELKSKTKIIPCIVCNKNRKVQLNTPIENYTCIKCSFEQFKSTGKFEDKIKKSNIKIKNGLSCKNCNKLLTNTQKFYCSSKCNYEQTDFVKLGKLGGDISKFNQNPRSKNEIYFYELCCKKFQNVKHNEKIFDGWDADVILMNEKIAVLWNGIWHYKQMSGNHSLLQTQTRDKIKLEIIPKHGFTPYVIKDMGAHKKKFVEEQFEVFIKWLDEQNKKTT